MDPSAQAAESTGVVAQPLFTDSARVMNFVAHQDDDSFAMSPDLWNNIANGRAVQSVVFTAGDAGIKDPPDTGPTCQSYVVSRGLGQKLAWEKAANQNFGGAWTVTTPVIVGQHKIYKETMPWAGHDLSIVYIGLANDNDTALEDLWKDFGSWGR